MMLPLLISATLCAPSPGLAGGGPENVLLLVNDDSSDSLAVANEYIGLRHVPAGNVVYLSGLPAGPSIKVADFRERVLQPVLGFAEQRGIAGQIDYLVYSAGFPYAVDVSEDMAGKQFPRFITQPASLTGLTYLQELVRSGSGDSLAIDANWYARRLRQEPTDQPWSEPDKGLQVRLQVLFAQCQEAQRKAAEAKTPVAPEVAQWLQDALTILQALVANHPATPELLYDLACVLALQGKPDEAMTSLQAAYDAGWWNATLTEADTDLSSLRERDDFKALLARMRQVVLETLPPEPFHSTTAWDRQGKATATGEGRRYLLSAMLAYTGGPASTLQEALDCLRTSCAADGSCPSGTVYYMASDDWARTGPRQWAFRSAVEALGKLGVRGEVVPGVLPKGRQDVAGVIVGAASFSWKECGGRILPGAFCDHLTSFGGAMAGAGQTLLSEFIRNGAAGACGTVTEPYNIPAKFPTAFLHVYYASGCSLAEAFYQSIRAPYQQLLVGDPLCQPWARIPEVRVRGLAVGEAVERPRRLVPTATSAQPVTRFELFVDGRRRQSCAPNQALTLDPQNLAEGYHEARVVAIAGPLETQGRTVLPFRIGRREVKVDGWPTEPVPVTGTLRLGVTLPGAARIVVRHNEREVGAADGPSGTVEIALSRLGLGCVELQPIGRLADGREVLGRPHAVTVTQPVDQAGAASGG